MAGNQLPPEIRKVEALDRRTGKKVVRYQLVADAGVDRITGHRIRVRRRFKTEREAREELGKLTHQVSTDSSAASSPTPSTAIPPSGEDVDAERLSTPISIHGQRSRTSLVIRAVIIAFIVLLIALGLYAAISGLLSSQSRSQHSDRLGLLGLHVCTVVPHCHREAHAPQAIRLLLDA